jgi:asparagine synthase (glutamine-hydrolysing)
LNTWLVSQAAARDVKGVLSGIGGDEWFAGYPVTRRMSRYAATAGGRAEALAGQMAHRLTGWLPQGRLRERMRNLATRRNALSTWLQSHTVFGHDLARGMAGFADVTGSAEETIAAALGHDCADWRDETMVGLSCLLDTRVYMIGQLLRDSDATSMAHSLELRVPLVDLQLVQFSRTCADDYKLRPDGGADSRYLESGSKRVLIHALRDVLPPAIANRTKKGFSLPFEHWMRGELAALVEETCGHEAVARRGLLDPQAVAIVRRRAAAQPGTSYPGLWALMIFELWCRGVLDPHRQPAPVARAGVIPKATPA